MDPQRGRSPSASHMQSHINPSHAPSPQQFQENVNGLGIETNQSTGNDQQNTAPAFDNNDFMKFDQVDPNFNQQAFNQQFKQEDQQSPFSQQQQQSFTQELLSPSISSNFNEGDFSLFSAANNQNEAYDPQLFMTELSPPANNPSINPAELNMSSPPNTHSPPGLLQPDSHSPQSAHQSPAFNQGAFQHSPGHSRHASLGPESAAFPQQGHMEWNMMAPQFQGHRRTPSEYSDVSVSSAAPSPNLGQHDSFDDRRHSPMQRPSDHMYQEVLGIGSFSLSDQGRGLSPAHSPAISPRLVPQQLPQINQPPYMIGMNNDFGEPQQSMYPSPDQEFPHIRQMNGSEMGQAQQMVPPEINVEFAPISRTNNFEPLKPSLDQDALTPPDRGRRRRAVSDPYNSISGGSRPLTPVGLSPGAASDRSGDTSRSLSPDDRSGNASPSRRRQSTSSLPNRDYILGLADPDYQAASAENGNAKRVQKHPATFQCTLCPKRFTRAYNLRSHLRTHTDERPFVCTVCGKAFARQHDRKRHEGLHSGEKKFVCKGELKQGGQWGCGRRFARADALGRHFRSEAGRICIKPLLDEEAIERQRVWQEQRVQDAHLQSPDLGFPGDASGNYTLPAALLAQYPALATISWSEIPQGDANDDDPSGRSSFDHSGSEYYDEADDGGYISGEPGIQQNYAQQAQMTERY